MLSEKDVKKQFLVKMRELLPEAKISAYDPGKNAEFKHLDLALNIKIGTIEKILVCEVKAKGEPRYIFQAVSKILSLSKMIQGGIPVIIAPNIGEKGMQICKEFKVGYIDLTGNTRLMLDSITIEKKGKTVKEKDYRYTKNIFSRKSSRILKYLLLDYKRRWTLAGLSEKASTTISYAHRVVKSLEKNGYVTHKKRGEITLVRPEALLIDWAKTYNVFNDNKVKGFYSFKKEVSEIMEQIKEVAAKNNLKYAFTLFTGAQLILPYVRHSNVYVYFSEDELSRWVDTLGLQPVDSGPNLYIINPYDPHIFLGIQNIKGFEVASNIQLFLDLYSFPARGEEQAIALKNEKIKFE